MAPLWQHVWGNGERLPGTVTGAGTIESETKAHSLPSWCSEADRGG